MGLFSTLKRNAKYALRGSWGRAILVFLLVTGVVMLLSILQQAATNVFVPNPMISNPTMEPPAGGIEDVLQSFYRTPQEWAIMGISSALALFLVTPLSLGALRWFFGLVQGKSMPVTEVFHFYESARAYGRAIWYDVSISIRCALWAIPFYIVPGGILGVCIYFLRDGQEAPRFTTAMASTGIFLSAVLFLLASVFYAVCVNRYQLTAYLIAESDDVSVGDAVKTSVRYTKGFRFSLLLFSLSFIGWFLLLIFFFPILYVWPYYSTAMAMYSRYIIDKNRIPEPKATQEFSARDEGEAEAGDARA